MRIVIFALIFLFPSFANACKCVDTDIREIINQSKYIFTARILSVEMEMCKTFEEPHPCVKAEFELLDGVKGKPEFRHIFSGIGGGDCGLSFRVGWRHIFFTDNDTVGICSKSGFYPDGDDEYLEAVKAYVDSGEDFDIEDFDIDVFPGLSCG